MKQFLPKINIEQNKQPAMAVPEILFSFDLPSDDEDVGIFTKRLHDFLLNDKSCSSSAISTKQPRTEVPQIVFNFELPSDEEDLPYFVFIDSLRKHLLEV